MVCVALQNVSVRNVFGELFDMGRIALDDHVIVGNTLDPLRDLTSSPSGPADDDMTLHIRDFLHV